MESKRMDKSSSMLTLTQQTLPDDKSVEDKIVDKLVDNIEENSVNNETPITSSTWRNIFNL